MRVFTGERLQGRRNLRLGNVFFSVMAVVMLALLIIVAMGGVAKAQVQSTGTRTLCSLEIGDRVVDPSWEWEYRLGTNYSDMFFDETTPLGEVRPVTWIVVAKDHYEGLEPHVTLLSEELIGLFAFDNSTDRDHEYTEYGYNHWGESGSGNASHGLRPWLNSSGIHEGEGFYQAFSESFKSVVLTTNLPNREWEYGNNYNTSDHVFIPSSTELNDEDHFMTYRIGSVYDYFAGAGDEKRIALMVGNEWYDLVYKLFDKEWMVGWGIHGNNWFYWARSPHSLEGNIVHLISATGAFSYIELPIVEFANSFIIGVRPALNLKSDTPVSASPNADGVYELDFYSAPETTKLIKWEITNNWEKSSLKKYFYDFQNRFGHKIDSCIDIFIDGDPKSVKARLSTGENINIYKIEDGHYRKCLKRYQFSKEKTLDDLFQFCLAIFTAGKNTMTIDIPEEYEDPLQLKIEEFLIDGESFNQSKTGQKLPELIPAYIDTASRWLEDQGTIITAQSPVDLLITNSKGEKIGALYENGQFSEEVNEIDGAFYGGQGLDMQFVYIPTYEGKPNIEVKGRGTGTYTLSIISFDNEQTISKTLSDKRLLETISFAEINIDEGSVHKFEIDRETLNQGGKGVNKKIDSNGDGNFEDVYTAGLTKAPDNPYPINKQSNVSTKPELRWQGGDVEIDKELKYSIYFGTEEMPTFKEIIGPYPGNKDIITYEPGLLAPGTTYYWGVTVTDSHGITVGSELWEFSTEDSDSEFYEIGLYDPSDGVFHLKGVTPYRYGPRNSEWLPLTGDWNGDGNYTVGLYDPIEGNFWLKGKDEVAHVRYGPKNSEWKPLAGDWNSDGEHTVGLYDPVSGVMHPYGTDPYRFGSIYESRIPIAGDWSGDKEYVIALYDPVDGFFHTKDAGPIRFGPKGSDWTPVTGDWNGDGTYGVGLHHDGHFHVKIDNWVASDWRYGPRGDTDWIPVTSRWLEAEAGLPDPGPDPDPEPEPEPEPEPGQAFFEAVSITTDPLPAGQITIEPYGVIDYLLQTTFSFTYTVTNTGSQQATQDLILKGFYSFDYGETNYYEEEYIVENVTINPGENYSYTRDTFIIPGELITFKLITDDDTLEYIIYRDYDLEF